jgi:predicted MPP superfamily phosphohydrolase
MNRRKFLKLAIYGGAGDYWEDELKIDATFSCSDENECRILLAHNPDSVDTAFNTSLSLVLSGPLVVRIMPQIKMAV